MMKKIKNIILFFAMIIVASSCTKVIDVDLNESNPRIVIDGSMNILDSNNRFARVKLQWSGSYYSSNDFKYINGAQLYLKSPEGQVHNLVNTVDGEYMSTDSIKGNSLDNFELYGTIEGVDFTAVSSMPNMARIDSVVALELPFGPPNPDHLLTPMVFFNDLPNEKNYYRYRISVNGENINELFYQADDGQDGKQMIFPFFNVFVFPGDTLKVQLLSLDKESFEYYQVLDQNIGGGGFSAAPGNPITNIQGDAIGIFTAQTVSERILVVE
jgi:hypothetical protein